MSIISCKDIEATAGLVFGDGGTWSQPTTFSIKSDNGGKIQNLTDVTSGIMLRLKWSRAPTRRRRSPLPLPPMPLPATMIILIPHHRRHVICFHGGGVGDDGEGPYLHWQREVVQQVVSDGIPWEYNPTTTRTRIKSGPHVNC